MNGTPEVKKTILVVEDAESIRRMVCAMLNQAGYRCLDAENGDAALRLLLSDPDAVDLVLTDVMMPTMGGPELARHVAQARPDLRVIFMSGFSEDPIVRSIERTPHLFMSKPFTAGTLMDKVRQALDAPWHGLPDTNMGAAT